jgi:lysophospholipid acyltransferase (LPLAT)-like uncharacterized protein
MSNLRERLGGDGLYLLSRITQRTARYQVSGHEHLPAIDDGAHPTIWVAWHGMTMMLSGFVLREYDPRNFIFMMPDDWRGATLKRWAEHVNAIPYPLNLKGDATMETARKLARLVRLLKNGHAAYITPDGPDGPAYVIKPGVAYLAQKSGARLLPVGAYTRTGYRVPRWDRYVVPRPFSRISVVIGEPLDAPKGVELEEITEPLTDVLHRVSARAAANYYEIAP